MNFVEVVGPHPGASHPCGAHLRAVDEYSDYGVPHRVLACENATRTGFTAAMRDWLVAHHASPEMLERDRLRIEAMSRLGFVNPKDHPGRFPINPKTQKGNWAEILLAEYVKNASTTSVPVYRLRYNPNIDQSMKGDDVLAFDLDSKPIRILVGEAKFRAIPSKQVVQDIVEALTRSHRSGVPVSLQFIADRLFDDGQAELGGKVENCSLLFALGELRLDYVGLLVSNTNAPAYVRKNAQTDLRRLAVMSLQLDDPSGMIDESYKGLSSP